MLAERAGLQLNDWDRMTFCSLKTIAWACQRIRDRRGRFNGLTYRIGRHILHLVEMICDIVRSIAEPPAGKTGSLLIIRPPGVGKMTLLRSVIQLKSLQFAKRIVVVDTSNEIAGDGNVPHSCISLARRMEVAKRSQQHKVLIEAVRNHKPQVIVVDEIGTEKEVEAVRAIAQRGVTIIGTAHGRDLQSILHTPEIDPLLGGKRTETLGDMEMIRRARASGKPMQTTVTKRAGVPPFNMALEIRDYNCVRFYPHVDKATDCLLAGTTFVIEERSRSSDGVYRSRWVDVGEGQKQSVFKTENWFQQLQLKRI